MTQDERQPQEAVLAFTKDIKPQWLNILRRLQQVSRQQQGLAIVEIVVLVDQDGNPIMWTSPKMTMFEPKNAAGQLLDFFRAMNQ